MAKGSSGKNPLKHANKGKGRSSAGTGHGKAVTVTKVSRRGKVGGKGRGSTY